MTAATATPATTVPTIDVSQTPRTPFARLVRVETRKAFDTRSSFWLMAATLGIVILADGIFTGVRITDDQTASLNDFSSVAGFVMSVFVPILAVMLVSSEWSQRTAMVTFTLEARRIRVILAKFATTVVLTVLLVVAALVVGVVCTLICEAAKSSGTVEWDLTAVDVVGVFLAQLLAAVGGFALACLLLNTPASIVVYLVYSFVLPGIFFAVAAAWTWFENIGPYLNIADAQDPLYDWSLNTGAEWAHLIVSTLIWVVAPLAFGLARILRAEVK